MYIVSTHAFCFKWDRSEHCVVLFWVWVRLGFWKEVERWLGVA